MVALLAGDVGGPFRSPMVAEATIGEIGIDGLVDDLRFV
jgi:hypothetical protein